MIELHSFSKPEIHHGKILDETTELKGKEINVEILAKNHNNPNAIVHLGDKIGHGLKTDDASSTLKTQSFVLHN